MQTSPAAQRISQLVHKTDGSLVVLSSAPRQLVVDDQRLRDWHAAQQRSLTYAHNVRAVRTNDGNILRIRTLGGVYTGTLEVKYATPTGNLSWSSNTLNVPCMANCGVDLVTDGDDVYAFWVDDDLVSVMTAHSTDNGHTWSSPAVVATVNAQGTGITIQLTASNKDTVFYTDSSIVHTASGLLTGVYVAMKVSGTWQTPILWDLGGQPMGVQPEVVLPNGDAYPSNLSSVQLDTGKAVLAYYGEGFREVFTNALYTQQVTNLDLTDPTPTLLWTHPQQYLSTIPIDDDNDASQITLQFPRLQQVGNEYWIVALESSKFARHERYHLAFIRSNDAKYFQDRDYHQGAANDEQTGAYIYHGDPIYGYGLYGDEVPFEVLDLIYANLVVCDDYTYIIGFDSAFYCASTTLVGVENPARQLDLTDYVDEWHATLPSAPNGGNASYNLLNVPKEWQDTDILTAHRGVRILHQAGYNTNWLYGDELVDVGQFWIDQIRQTARNGENGGSVHALDNTRLLEQWKADAFWNYKSPEQIIVNQWCDLTPIIRLWGDFLTTGNGVLRNGIVTARDNFKDNVASFNADQTGDGEVVIQRFCCNRTWTNNHAGLLFQGQQKGIADDNKRVWGVYYNHPRATGRFSLVQTVPVTKPNIAQFYRFRQVVAQSTPVVLSAGTWYWMKMATYHGHVRLWYSTDVQVTVFDEVLGESITTHVFDPNWIEVLDYRTPATPQHSVLPCRLGWNGFAGTQRTTPSGVIGHTGTSNGQQSLADGGGNPLMVATLVGLNNIPSILRRIGVAITQENTTTTPMPDINVLLGTGSGSSPDDLTDEDNVLYAKDMSALHFSNHDSPRWVGATAKKNPERLRLGANETVWVAATFDGTLVAGQSFKYASFASGGLTKISTDGGATWSSAPNVMAAVLEVEYLNGLVRFSKLYHTSADEFKTYEDVIRQIAAKAGILDLTVFDWVNQADMTLLGDGLTWQPLAFGTLGDTVIDLDYSFAGSIYSTSPFRLLVGADSIGEGDNACCIIELDADDQMVRFYTTGNVLTDESASIQFMPLQGHLRVVIQKQCIYVYINDCLTAWTYHPSFSRVGYVGFDANGNTISNFRIPDLYQTVEYFDIQAGETGLAALNRLINTPARGSTTRIKWFIRPDGSLEVGSYRRRTLADTYEDTQIETTKTESANGIVTIISAQGNYYSVRTDPITLGTDGRIYDQRQVTDAPSDIDAYNATEDEFRRSREGQLTPQIQDLPDWAIEREDLTLLIDPQTKTRDFFIRDSIQFDFTPNSNEGQVTATIQYRKFEGDLIDA